MKIAIISDTHDNSNAVVWIIEYLNKHKITIALHAGDIVAPGIIRRFEKYYDGHLHFVFGNNDGEKMLLTQIADNSDKLTCHNREMEKTFAGKKFYMNHYTRNAKAALTTGNYDVCIGGHTHQYEISKMDKSLLINPGSTVTRDKWLMQESEKESSFVILDLDSLEYERIMTEE